MTLLKLYSPAIVLAVWAVVWAAGATTDAVMVVFLTLTAMATVIHVRTSLERRWRDRRA